jgi:hypothetical protein
LPSGLQSCCMPYWRSGVASVSGGRRILHRRLRKPKQFEHRVVEIRPRVQFALTAPRASHAGIWGRLTGGRPNTDDSLAFGTVRFDRIDRSTREETSRFDTLFTLVVRHWGTATPWEQVYGCDR